MGASPGAASAVRHARGIAAYVRILAVPEDQVAAAFAARVGPVFIHARVAARLPAAAGGAHETAG